MSDDTIKLSAIVIKATKSGENDKMLTLISQEEGKVTVLAKGLMSLKHKSKSACAPLCYSSFVLKKVKDGFYTLISAELIESFRTLSEDVVLLSYGAYFSSLAGMCVQSGVGADEEVRLLLNTLYVLCKRPDEAALIKTVFEFKIMELCGIVPEFEYECPCGKEGSFFSVSEGEVRCSEHKTPEAIPIHKAQIQLAKYLTESTLKDALFCSCDKRVSFSLSSVTEPFLQYHLGNLPNSLDYLHSIIEKF
ncbi:MAG: DNA repair protein RecO [Clostridia bacterium]|nr:DNA repair protein RecO [Clostridia bacterium]